MSISVLLLVPPAYKASRLFFDVHLGIGCVASALLQQGAKVDVLDLNLASDPWKVLEERLSAVPPAVVGTTSTTSNYHHAARVLCRAGALCPDATRLIGGPHITALPHQILQRLQCEICVVGESEGIIPESLPALSSLHAKARSEGRPAIVIGEPIPLRDAKPFPWHLFPTEEYAKRNGGHLSMMASRGCARRCVFCVSPALWHRYVRFRPVTAIARDIDVLRQSVPDAAVNFRDDDIAVNRGHLEGLCLIARERHLRWLGEAAPESIDVSEAKLMAESGMTELRVGLECPDSRGRSILGKPPINMSQLRDVVRAFRDYGPTRVKLNILIGIPGLSEEEERQNIELLAPFKDLDASFIINIITPLPGSLLYESPEQHGIVIRSKRWKDLVPENPVYKTSLMSEEQIHAVYAEAQRVLAGRTVLAGPWAVDSAHVGEEPTETHLGSLSLVSALVLCPAGVLLLRHVGSGTWLPPGGKAHPGEPPFAAVSRELREEANVSLDSPQSIEQIGTLPIRLSDGRTLGYFRVRLMTTPLVTVNSREHSAYTWARSVADLPLPMHPAVKRVLIPYLIQR
jgi:anaerobic magnesium-protoporphyrin IX monomethyl ester cyclase